MQIRTATIPVESSGLKEQGAFSIKATGKAFKILSDGLYSNKPLAIVRELSCNAWDAHVAAHKTDVPFEVRLPTRLDLQFHVKDWGIGLSHDEVMHLYTTYFESTKSDSNDFIGALGLGSKSPFSYVDQFMVSSRYDGMQRMYSAYLDGGFPQIALLSEEQTDEDNGIEVSLPVKLNDVDKFRESAISVLKWFKQSPKIVNGSDIDLSYTTVLEGRGWRLVEDLPGHSVPASGRQWIRSYVSNNRALALMGNVAYPLNSSALSELDRNLLEILNSPFVIEFPIGSLDVVASREGLSYDAATIHSITMKLCEIQKELRDTVAKKIQNAKTKWEAHIELNEILEGMNLKNLLGNDFLLQWKGQAISSKGVRVSSKYINCRTFNRYRAVNARNLEYKTSIRPTKETRIYIADQKAGWGARLVQDVESAGYMDRDKRRKVIVLNFHTCTKDTFKHGLPQVLKDALKELGDPPYILTSSLAPLPSTTTQTVGKKRVTLQKVYQFENGGAYPQEVKTYDLNKRELYVHLKRFSPYNGEEKVSRYEFKKILKQARTLELITQDTIIYAIPATHKNTIKNTNWVEFFGELKQLVEKNRRKYVKNFYKDEVWKLRAEKPALKLLWQEIEVSKEIFKCKKLNKILKIMNVQVSPVITSNVNRISNLSEFFNLKPFKPINLQPITKIIEEFEQENSILIRALEVPDWRTGRKIEPGQVVEYLKLKEKANDTSIHHDPIKCNART